jgi:hypothetical protein
MRADLLELADVRSSACAGGHQRPDLRDLVLADVEHSGAVRRQQPFVQRCAVVIAIQIVACLNGNCAKACAPSTITSMPRLRAKLTDLFDRENLAGEIGDVAEVDDARARGNGASQQRSTRSSSEGDGVGKETGLQHDPVAALALPPRGDHARIILIGGQDFVAGFRSRPSWHDFQPLGGVARDGDFFRVAAEIGSQPLLARAPASGVTSFRDPHTTHHSHRHIRGRRRPGAAQPSAELETQAGRADAILGFQPGVRQGRRLHQRATPAQSRPAGRCRHRRHQGQNRQERNLHFLAGGGRQPHRSRPGQTRAPEHLHPQMPGSVRQARHPQHRRAERHHPEYGAAAAGGRDRQGLHEKYFASCEKNKVRILWEPYAGGPNIATGPVGWEALFKAFNDSPHVGCSSIRRTWSGSSWTRWRRRANSPTRFTMSI